MKFFDQISNMATPSFTVALLAVVALSGPLSANANQLIESGDVCGANGQRVVDAVMTRYEHFKDREVQGVLRSVKQTTFEKNQRDMISMGGGVQGAITGVGGEVQNNRQQMKDASEGYCKINAGCTDARSLGWPDNMPANLPEGSSGSASFARAYVMVSLMHDLNSVTLRGLRCGR